MDGFDRKKALLFAFLKGLQVEFFAFFIMIFFWAVSVAMKVLANLIFGFAGLMCVVCILLDYGLKQGETAGTKNKLHGDEINESFGILMGLAAMAPYALTAILLVLSRAGAIPDIMPAYKVLNAALYPVFDLFAHSAYVKDMHPAVFILVAGYLALFPISCAVGFRLGFNKIDLKDKVIYKK
ncbi:MAG: hypothetical protein IJ806_04895 [Ruminococcus sp.]|nr:hypothetical protein [Ruminococcus sp.]